MANGLAPMSFAKGSMDKNRASKTQLKLLLLSQKHFRCHVSNGSGHTRHVIQAIVGIGMSRKLSGQPKIHQLDVAALMGNGGEEENEMRDCFEKQGKGIGTNQARDNLPNQIPHFAA